MNTEPALARTTDPDTSHAAAASLALATLSEVQRAVYMAVLDAEPGGLTTVEIAKLTDIERITVSPRIKPLCEAGWLRDSGQRRIPAGHRVSSIIWRVARRPDERASDS